MTFGNASMGMSQNPVKFRVRPKPVSGPIYKTKLKKEFCPVTPKARIQCPRQKPRNQIVSGSGPDGPAHCVESNHPADGAASRKAQKLPRVNNRILYDLASPELRMHIDIAGGGDQNPTPTLYAIETGVWSRLSEIGTNISAWHDGYQSTDSSWARSWPWIDHRRKVE